MFSSFIYFGEVTKLSTSIKYGLDQINYSDDLLNLIILRKDIDSFEQVIDMIGCKSTDIEKLFSIAVLVSNQHTISNRWLNCIEKIFPSEKEKISDVRHIIDLKNLCSNEIGRNNILLKASENGNLWDVKYVLYQYPCEAP